MKTPISYYGGKQRIASRIVEILNTIPHQVYCEPFAGGLAVLFAKPQPGGDRNSYQEAINDTNKNLITFYKVARENPEELARWIELTPYSRVDHQRAWDIYSDPSNYSDLEIAWAVYVQCNMSFANNIGGSWGIGRVGNRASVWANRKYRLPECFRRLERVYMDCRDALLFIQQWDSPGTLFYCDPPYPKSDQGHYSGYTLEDWQNLCQLLDNIQGSYVLSGYDQSIAPQSAQIVKHIEATMTAAHGKDRRSGKVKTTRMEILWICNRSGTEQKQLGLFNF